MENPLLKYLAFVKTAEKGSFTRAAQELNYAQSSVSKMVADLEQVWDMTLLERCPYATDRCREEAPCQREVEPGHYAVCHLFDE